MTFEAAVRLDFWPLSRGAGGGGIACRYVIVYLTRRREGVPRGFFMQTWEQVQGT